MTVDTKLKVDHVSIAVPRIDEALSFFKTHFPVEMGMPTLPGQTADFNWSDFYIGSFKIELIEAVGESSFVSRFIGKRGPGMHHWSLETTHLDALIERMEHDGLRIVDKFVEDSGWSTAFISPRTAFGVLIQLWQGPAQPEIERDPVASHRLRNGETVRMRADHLSIAVRDIEKTLAFFKAYFPFRLRRAPHPGWDGTFLIASFYLNDYKVELIQPAMGKSGFVERFITRRGEGLHHISIDIDRLDPYADQLAKDGLRIVDRRELPGGVKTAFISPKSAYGTLIQLWQPARFGDRG